MYQNRDGDAVVTIRLPAALIAAADKILEELRAESPYRKHTRSEVLRDLLVAGLTSTERAA